jgi:hypothetical protein
MGSRAKDGGEGGIRTHVPFRTRRFRGAPVTTTSVPLQAGRRTFILPCSPAARKVRPYSEFKKNVTRFALSSELSARYRFVVQQIIVIAVRADDLVAERAYGWIVSEITVLVIAWL